MAVIPTPVTRTKISTVQWGIPITNEVNALRTEVDALKTATAKTAWTNFTMQNGWLSTTSPIGYRKIGDLVYLRGETASGTWQSVFGTLPAGFRPPFNLSFVVFSWTTTQSFCQLYVKADGTCQGYGPTAGSIAVDGVVFSI